MGVEVAPPSGALIELRFASSVGCATSEFPVAVVPKPVEMSSATVVGYCSHLAVSEAFEHDRHFVHGFEAAEEIGVPEGEAIRKQESELQWEVRPHNGESELGVEVDDDGAGKHGCRRAASRVESNDRSPAEFLDESLLKGAPAIADIPAEPRAVDAGESLLPFSRSFINCVERDWEPCPVAFAEL